MALRILTKTPTYATEEDLATAYPYLSDVGEGGLSSTERNELLLTAESYVDFYVGSSSKIKSTYEGQSTLFPRKQDSVPTRNKGNHNFSLNLPGSPFAGDFWKISAGGTMNDINFVEGYYALYFGGLWFVQEEEPDCLEWIIPDNVKRATLLMAYIIEAEKGLFEQSAGLNDSEGGSCVDAGMSVRIGTITIKKSAEVDTHSWWNLNSTRDSFTSGRKATIAFLSEFEYGRRFMAYLQPYTNKIGGHNYF